MMMTIPYSSSPSPSLYLPHDDDPPILPLPLILYISILCLLFLGPLEARKIGIGHPPSQQNVLQ